MEKPADADPDRYYETPIDYVLRLHADKVLKL